eukprot:Nk52_evm3s914 gene=Nk52_evmTU3s914
MGSLAAPSGRETKQTNSPIWALLLWVKDLAFNPIHNSKVALLLLLLECVLNVIIIQRVPYTEIDWQAYMEEVEGFLGGDWNYANLRGGTGPLVYPAGFVYIFSALYHLTGNGVLIVRAQYLFAGLYVLFLAVVFVLYCRCGKTPPYVLVLLSLTSRRVHSIFVLRLFNDPVAMLFLYISIAIFMHSSSCKPPSSSPTPGSGSWHWFLGCAVYSFAVSIKMNILLFAPGLLLLLLIHLPSLTHVIGCLSLCAAVQLILGAPFLLTYPLQYMKGAFNFGRQFFYIWTVNWKFVDEETFLDRRFHIMLLMLQVVVLLSVGWIVYKRVDLKSPSGIFLCLSMSNFIGMVFARSLHYQFYVWYYHTLPFILWSYPLPTFIRLALLAAFEYCWNVYPATPMSSAILQANHLVVLMTFYATLLSLQPPAPSVHSSKKER